MMYFGLLVIKGYQKLLLIIFKRKSMISTLITSSTTKFIVIIKNIIPVFLLLFFSCNDKDVNSDTVFDYTLHTNNRVASLKMSSSDYDSWINEDGFANTESRLKVVNDLYNVFEDQYDFIFFILNEPSIPENLFYYGKLIGISNSVQGLGFLPYDNSLQYGSNGKLKAVIQLTGLEYLKYGPALHELAHQWANFALSTHSVDAPGEDLSSYLYTGHWGFTGGSTPGQLGGFNQNTLISNGNNSYSVESFGPFANGGNSVPYNELELYLMGMIDVSSVNDFDMFTEITSLSVNESTFDFTAAQRTTYTSSSLVDLLGQRVPGNTNSQKEFNLLVLVITKESLTNEEWDIVDANAEWFSKTESDETSLYNFWEATGGQGSLKIGF